MSSLIGRRNFNREISSLIGQCDTNREMSSLIGQCDAHREMSSLIGRHNANREMPPLIGRRYVLNILIGLWKAGQIAPQGAPRLLWLHNGLKKEAH